MSLVRVFQIVLRCGVENPPTGGALGTFTRGEFFSSGGAHLRRSAFDHSSFFQIKKHSVNIEH